mgnify:CR=1 FL=1|jgi:hypothetical protein
MASITLLGPQYRDPNLAAALRERGLSGGPFVSISAGWQEREGEIDELRAHIGAPVEDLRIYERTEDVFSADRALRLAHRARQARLQEMQELYALRLGHAKQAARELFDRSASAAVLLPARRQAIAALRRLDRSHLFAIRAVHDEFEREFEPAQRVAVAHARAAVLRALEPSTAVLIAGGHVAALVNRLRLLGAAEWLAGRPLFAWSAGAMALGESVVLFHDQPPQGGANAEVLDAGLGLLPGVLPLPHAQSRLHLHDERRVAVFARRFAPNACVTLDHGACLGFDAGSLRFHTGSFQLSRRGELAQPIMDAGTRGGERAHA